MLDRSTREALLDTAGRLAAQLQREECRQAAVALAILRRHGVEALINALALDLPAGGAERQWRGFRRVVGPEVVTSVHAEHGVAGLAYLLGWLRRGPLAGSHRGSRHRGRTGAR